MAWRAAWLRHARHADDSGEIIKKWTRKIRARDEEEGFSIVIKSFAYSVCIVILVCAAAFSQVHRDSGFRTLHVNAGQVSGEIRSFQGLNGPPSPVMAGLPNLVPQYKELRVTQVRTHDFMGPTEIDSHFEESNPLLAWLIPDPAQRAGVVKAGNASIIYPDWSADPEKAESYHFAASDNVFAAIRATGRESTIASGEAGARTSSRLPISINMPMS